MQETYALLCNMEANSKQQEAAKAQSATAKEKERPKEKRKKPMKQIADAMQK